MLPTARILALAAASLWLGEIPGQTPTPSKEPQKGDPTQQGSAGEKQGKTGEKAGPQGKDPKQDPKKDPKQDPKPGAKKPGGAVDETDITFSALANRLRISLKTPV